MLKYAVAFKPSNDWLLGDGSMDSCNWQLIVTTFCAPHKKSVIIPRIPEPTVQFCRALPTEASTFCSWPDMVFCCCSSSPGFTVWDFLVNTTVQSGYLCYCSLSVCLNQYGHFLLVSPINKAFHSASLLHHLTNVHKRTRSAVLMVDVNIMQTCWSVGPIISWSILKK